MQKILHLLLTRFNLAIHFGCEKRPDSKCPDKPWLNEEYLTERFKIFEKWTYPSIQNQTDHNFRWIVLFHKDTPEKFKQKIQNYVDNMSNLDAWYLNDEECQDFENIIYQYIKTNYSSSAIITTRIDNDDLVHESFIESIKKDFLYKNSMEILSYENGLQYDSHNHILLKYDYENNHFLSLYASEANGEVNHILQFNHTWIDEDVLEKHMSKIVLHKEPPLWVEIITGSNYSNQTRWRIKKVLVPQFYGKEYCLLGLWKGSIGGYVRSVVRAIVKVFMNRGKKVLMRLAKYALP